MRNDGGKHNYFPSRFRGKNTEKTCSAPKPTEKTFSAPESAETLNFFRPVSAEKIRKNIFRTDLDGKCFSVRFLRKTDGKYVRCISKPTRSVGNQFKCPSSVQHAHKGAHNTICFFPCQFAFQIVPDTQLLCVGVGGCALKLRGDMGISICGAWCTCVCMTTIHCCSFSKLVCWCYAVQNAWVGYPVSGPNPSPTYGL